MRGNLHSFVDLVIKGCLVGFQDFEGKYWLSEHLRVRVCPMFEDVGLVSVLHCICKVFPAPLVQ